MPISSGILPPGSRAPDFTLEAAQDGNVSLADYRGAKNVVLVFLRGFA